MFQAELVLCLLFTVLVPGLAGHNAAISLHTTQSTEIQTSECAQVSDELCDICAIFADAALNVLEQKNSEFQICSCMYFPRGACEMTPHACTGVRELLCISPAVHDCMHGYA